MCLSLQSVCCNNRIGSCAASCEHFGGVVEDQSCARTSWCIPSWDTERGILLSSRESPCALCSCNYDRKVCHNLLHDTGSSHPPWLSIFAAVLCVLQRLSSFVDHGSQSSSSPDFRIFYRIEGLPVRIWKEVLDCWSIQSLPSPLQLDFDSKSLQDYPDRNL